MRRHGVRSEDGSALMLVLVLLIVLSLALGAMFANAGANLTMSTVVTGQDNKVYAADGGVEFAIQQLRANSSLCSAGVSLPSTTIDGRAVEVSCSPTAGLATSVSPWALVTADTDTADPSLTTKSFLQTIDGPVYLSGTANLLSPLTVRFGDFLQTGTCPQPANLSVLGTYVSACATTMPIPDPEPSLPPPSFAQQLPMNPEPAFTTAGGCSIWKPGKYKSDLNLGTDNYFASGIYYFEDTSINLDGKSAIGGRPGPDYPKAPALPSTACSSVTDQTAGVADGFGVEFILGGTSTISVNDGSGKRPAQLELFARLPGTSSEGTPGISIRTVPLSAKPTGWEPTVGQPLVVSSTGVNPRLAVHGYVYVPEGSVSVHADGNVPLAGGLFCWKASLSSRGGVQISVADEDLGVRAQRRYVVITSTAKGDPGQKTITSTAVVGIGNDAARTVDVQSWVTSNP